MGERVVGHASTVRPCPSSIDTPWRDRNSPHRVPPQGDATGTPSGRTSSAPPRSPTARGRHVIEDANGHRRARVAGVATSLSVKSVQPGPRRSTRRPSQPRGWNPHVGDAPAQVDMELVDDGATTAFRVGRPGDVVLRHAAPLELVGVEQVGFGPAPEDPRELPAEIEAAGEREVHPGSAAGVTRWAASPARKVLPARNRAAISPRRVEADRRVRCARRHRRRAPTRIMAARASASSCIVLRAGGVHPTIVDTRGEERSRSRRGRDGIEHVAPLSEQLPQRRA